jgi:hypothetical protein
MRVGHNSLSSPSGKRFSAMDYASQPGYKGVRRVHNDLRSTLGYLTAGLIAVVLVYSDRASKMPATVAYVTGNEIVD